MHEDNLGVKLQLGWRSIRNKNTQAVRLSLTHYCGGSMSKDFLIIGCEIV
jgi:hypothetical protein